MPLIAGKILIGFLVGTLIGLTGLGGGVLLLPLLIFGMHVPAITAVGSDALFNFCTKIGSSWMHLRKGTVRRKVVVAMAIGSIPGSYAGVSLLTHLRTLYGTGVNDFIKSAVGLLLVCIPVLLLSGVLLPLSLAPAWLTALSYANPLRYAVDATRALVQGHLETTDAIRGLAVCGAFVLAAVVLSIQHFRRGIA